FPGVRKALFQTRIALRPDDAIPCVLQSTLQPHVRAKARREQPQMTKRTAISVAASWTIRTLSILVVGTGLLVLSAAGAAQTQSAAGHWEGNIQMPNRDLSITVDLAKGKTGKWIGSMSVLGSSSIDVPLGNIAVQDTAVAFTATLPQSASFDGKLSAD